MPEYDSPWKEAIDLYFPSFMELCFRDLHRLIDWSCAPKMLEKELLQIAPQSETGLRTVDKLVEVKLLSGEINWLLIHLEIQSQPTQAFAHRMFVYFYRTSDKYDRAVVSLAVLGENQRDWRPQRYEKEQYGCRVQFDFPTLKLLDLLDHVGELEASNNPFATVILAHLMTMQTVGRPEDRCEWKLRLLRPMYERGMSADQVRDLFRVLDWMMELPTDLAIRFDAEREKIEEEHSMPYITSTERRAIERGREEGREEGRVAGQIQLLQRLLGREESTVEHLLADPLEKLRTDLEVLQQELTSRNK